MHLVAVGTEYYKISNIVINSISIDMSYFENLRDAKTAMSAERGIVLECYLSVIDSLSHDSILALTRLICIQIKPKTPQILPYETPSKFH
mgnify:CR=1 FL=1